MSKTYTFGVLERDGIGLEIAAEAVRALKAIETKGAARFTFWPRRL